MFVSTSLAEEIDLAEARLTHAIGRALENQGTRDGLLVRQLAGGVVVYAGPMSPMSKLIGVGFHGMPTSEELGRIEDHFDSRQAPLQAELSTFSDPAFGRLLATRGYLLEGFENVLGRPLDAADALPSAPEGMLIRQMAPHEDRLWLEESINGFGHADAQGIAAPELPPRELLESALEGFLLAPDFLRFGAWIDGELAGVCCLRLDGKLAQLCGATTLPRFRRLGVQSALLRQRLAVAVAAGCTLALMTTQPGSKSHQNGCRLGFVQLLNRALLVRPPGP